MKHIITGLIGFAVAIIFFGGFLVGRVTAPHNMSEIWPLPLPAEVACTADAMQCPDGSYVGRTGPTCAFVCPEANESGHTSDVIVETTLENLVSPLVITGQAKGPWFFEASFPVSLVNWDGLIIAEGIATAGGEWMTEDFVPFSTTLTFASPYHVGDPDFMKRGSLILKKDNPSGLPEHDASLELPVTFAPLPATPTR